MPLPAYTWWHGNLPADPLGLEMRLLRDATAGGSSPVRQMPSRNQCGIVDCNAQGQPCPVGNPGSDPHNAYVVATQSWTLRPNLGTGLANELASHNLPDEAMLLMMDQEAYFQTDPVGTPQCAGYAGANLANNLLSVRAIHAAAAAALPAAARYGMYRIWNQKTGAGLIGQRWGFVDGEPGAPGLASTLVPAAERPRAFFIIVHGRDPDFEAGQALSESFLQDVAAHNLGTLALLQVVIYRDPHVDNEAGALLTDAQIRAQTELIARYLPGSHHVVRPSLDAWAAAAHMAELIRDFLLSRGPPVKSYRHGLGGRRVATR